MILDSLKTLAGAFIACSVIWFFPKIAASILFILVLGMIYIDLYYAFSANKGVPDKDISKWWWR